MYYLDSFTNSETNLDEILKRASLILEYLKKCLAEIKERSLPKQPSLEKLIEIR